MIRLKYILFLWLVSSACSKSVNGTFPADSSGSNFISTSDSFNRANSVNNPGSQTDAAIIGTPWPYEAAHSGSIFGINSNQLYINTLGASSVAFIGMDPGKSNCDIEVTFGTLAVAGQSAIVFRGSSAGNQFGVFIDKNTHALPAGHYLFKFSGGGPVPVDSEVVTAPVDGETIRIEQTTTTINVYLNGNPTPILTTTDSDYSSNTLIAIGATADTTTTFDSWVIENCD